MSVNFVVDKNVAKRGGGGGGRLIMCLTVPKKGV